MAEKIVPIMLNLFGGIKSIPFGREIIAVILSMSPILELRGGIIAARSLGMAPIPSFIICYIANLIPVPFILWFIKKIFNWMLNSSVNFFNKIAKWLDKKVTKNKKVIEKYGFWGLLFFIAVPLPGSGAWTGCLIAALLDIDKKKAFLAAVVGVFIAGLIISVLSIGIFDGLLG